MHVWSRPKPLPLALVAGTVLAVALLAYAAVSGSFVPLALLGAVMVAALVLADWAAAVPLLLITASVDGFVKHVSASALTYVLKDALLALMLLGLTVWLVANRHERPDGVRLRGAIAWAVYVAFMLTQIVHPAGSWAGAASAFRAHALFALLIVAGVVYFRRPERLGRLADLALALCALCAAAAVVQHLLGARWLALGPGFMKASLHYTSFPSAALRATGNDLAVYRMYGTLVDPAALGLTCAYGILFAIAAMARLRGWGRALAIAAIPLLGIGLALAQARAAMGGLAIGLVVLAAIMFARPAMRGFALAGIVLLVAAVPVALALTHGSVADRVLSQDQVAYAQATRDVSQSIVLNDIATHPFGHGLGATGSGGNLRDDPGLGVDNVFFANLYETGVPGLAVFVAVQLTLLGLAIRAALRARERGAQTAFAGIAAGQVALLASCWFSQGAFDYAPLAQMFWLFAGAVARADAWA